MRTTNLLNAEYVIDLTTGLRQSQPNLPTVPRQVLDTMLSGYAENEEEMRRTAIRIDAC